MWYFKQHGGEKKWGKQKTDFNQSIAVSIFFVKNRRITDQIK